MLGCCSPGGELLSITLIGFCLLPCAGQLHLTPAGQKQLGGATAPLSQTQPRRYAPVKGSYHKNSSGTLRLHITHSLVTQVITRLEQRTCKAPRERHSCWLGFLVTREMQKWLLSDVDGVDGVQKTPPPVTSLCSPVFTKCVVVHSLWLHVWVKVLFFLYCSRNKRKTTFHT